MPARNPAEAVEQYRQPLQRALSCITRDELVTFGSGGQSPYRPRSEPQVLALRHGHFVALSGPERLALRVLYRYQIVEALDDPGWWGIRTREYSYSIARIESEQRDEIVAYHWHPAGLGPITWPHLHIGRAVAGSALRFGERHLHRIHFPTDQVRLSSVVRLLIDEFGVEPLRAD